MVNFIGRSGNATIANHLAAVGGGTRAPQQIQLAQSAAPNDLGALLNSLAKPYLNGTDTAMKQAHTDAYSAQAAKTTSEIAAAQEKAEVVRRLSDAVTRGELNTREAEALGVRAGIDWKQFGGYALREKVRTDPNIMGPGVAGAQIGAGESFSSTGMSTAKDLENKLIIQKVTEAANIRKAEMENANRIALKGMDTRDTIDASGNPVLTRLDQSYGQRPLTSLDQEKSLEAQRQLPTASPEQKQTFAFGAPPARVPRNYQLGADTFITNEGVTNAQTGERLPPGGRIVGLEASNADDLTAKSPILKDLVASRTATETAMAGIDRLSADLSKPGADAAVGWMGQGAILLNNVRAQTEAAVKTFGGPGFQQEMSDPNVLTSVQRAVDGNAALLAKAQRMGIDSAVLKSQIADLAYTIAKTQDPSGRVSDQDVQHAAGTIGATLGDPTATVRVLSDLKQRLVVSQNIRESVIRGVYGQGAANVPAWGGGGAAPQQPAQAAPAGPQQFQTPTGTVTVRKRVQ
jgi:hypothetical protein